MAEFEDDSFQGDSELYKFDFDSDGLDDFVFITNNGRALCTKPYFLKSDEKKQLVPVKGIDTRELENEGKLCNDWGQSLSFLYIAGEVRAVTKDTDPGDTETDSALTMQGPVPAAFAVYKIGITEKTEPVCRVRMELRVR